MRKKILLIDDDEDLLRSFQVILESHGFDVITCNEGTGGLSVLKKDKPDLLVLDVMMNSNLERYDLLNVIKKDSDHRKMPVIILTVTRDLLGVNLISDEEDETVFPDVHFEDKSINPHLLVEIIGDMLKE